LSESSESERAGWARGEIALAEVLDGRCGPEESSLLRFLPSVK